MTTDVEGWKRFVGRPVRIRMGVNAPWSAWMVKEVRADREEVDFEECWNEEKEVRKVTVKMNRIEVEPLNVPDE